MQFSKQLSFAILLVSLVGFVSGCDALRTNTGGGKGSVELQFKTVSGSSASKAVSSDNVHSSHDSLLIEGTNGTLQIDDIRFIVEKFKLEPVDTDEEEDSLETKTEEFEAEPFFVDLPLTTDTLNLGDSKIKAGTYQELEFEVKDLDFEEEEDNEGNTALADSIRAEFPDWPEEASMVIVGSFTPNDGQKQPFKVFAKAEIEIEREFSPPLEVTEDNIEKVISIRINPTAWLKKDDGSVYDISRYDWEENHELLEFEAKFKDGIEEIEVDDDDDDDDD